MRRGRLFWLGLMAFLMLACHSGTQESIKVPLEIWFEHPTAKWNEGLPIGNGRLGAMLYGTPAKEIICLNEETIWSGEKDYNADKKGGAKYIAEAQQLIFDQEYAKAEALLVDKVMGERLPSGTITYQMLADLFVERDDVGEVSDFRTGLNLNTASTLTSFVSNGITFKRESFSSTPAQAMVFKYTVDQKGAINLKFSVKRTNKTTIELSDNRIVFSEHVGNGFGVKFHAIISVEAKNGVALVEDGKLCVKEADEVILRVVAASDYNQENPQQTCEEEMNAALTQSYDALFESHVAEYKAYFDRVSFKIADVVKDTIPTDVRLQNIKAGDIDNYVTEVQYQYGRYLLLSSSRPGTMPANLQGIWVNAFDPPWNSDYHININIQMNYWPAEMTNLSECHEPMLKYVGDLREMGRLTAKETYGVGGFVAHHTSDAWMMTRSFGKPNYGMWPMGAAWCCQHLYTHYEYTEDKDYLRNFAYPVMKEAAQFFVEYMVKNPKTGQLVSGPSISPENKFITKDGKVSTINMGPTMDRAIIFELFSNCISSAAILNMDEGFVAILKGKMAQMPPLQIGSDGRLMEWTEEFEEENPGHRHISHLYALHPSNQITQSRTPELFAAAKKTIEYRLSHGGGHTGWSRAWIINFWARLLEPEKAFENIIALQQKSTLPNLLDLHPPFQIDGNFGVVSGITEMLMQSHDEEINLLPALPAAWTNGEIKGIVARGGFELDLVWNQGQLQSVKVLSKLGNDLKLRYGATVKNYTTTKGEVLVLDVVLEK